MNLVKTLFAVGLAGMLLPRCTEMKAEKDKNITVFHSLDSTYKYVTQLGQQNDYAPVDVILSDSMIKKDMASDTTTSIQNYVANHYSATLFDGMDESVEGYKKNLYRGNLICILVSGKEVRKMVGADCGLHDWHVNLYHFDDKTPGEKKLVSSVKWPWQEIKPDSVKQIMERNVPHY